MDSVRDGAGGGVLPCGEDTIVLRLTWPAAPPQGLQGRMWRMRPLGTGRRVSGAVDSISIVGIVDAGVANQVAPIASILDGNARSVATS